MSLDQRDHILGEIAAVERILGGMPNDGGADRLSMEARLADLREELAACSYETAPARAVITFRGRPVVGSHGIFVDFATAATKAFSDLVTAIVAAARQDLRATGPVPGRDSARLLVTNTAVGSFGFALEAHRDPRSSMESLFADDDALQRAISEAQSILEATTLSDDELTEVVVALEHRVVVAARQFIEVLSKSDATCAVRSAGRTVAYHDGNQVRNAVDRLADTNRQEQKREVTGRFQGYLPKSGEFEFVDAADGNVLKGKVRVESSAAIAINEHLDELATITLLETRIGGGRPRFILAELPRWESRPSR